MNGSGDMEAASASGGGMVGGDEDEVVYLDPFNIATTKNASVETLKRWRVRFVALSSLVWLLHALYFNAVPLMNHQFFYFFIFCY